MLCRYHASSITQRADAPTLGTSASGGLRQVRWYPKRHLLHSSLGTLSGSADPHTWQTSSSAKSSSLNKPSVILRYALSPTRNVSPSTTTDGRNWRRCLCELLTFLERLRRGLLPAETSEVSLSALADFALAYEDVLLSSDCAAGAAAPFCACTSNWVCRKPEMLDAYSHVQLRMYKET